MDSRLIPTEYIAQVFGGVAIVMSLIVYSRKKKTHLLTFKAVQDLCWLSHYLLLSAYSAAATSALCVVRSAVFYRTGKETRSSKLPLAIFLALYALSAVLTWKSVFSIFPAVSSSISTVAFWMKNPNHTRVLAISAALCTLTYNITVAHSLSVYVGVSFTILTSVASLIAQRKKS